MPEKPHQKDRGLDADKTRKYLDKQGLNPESSGYVKAATHVAGDDMSRRTKILSELGRRGAAKTNARRRQSIRNAENLAKLRLEERIAELKKGNNLDFED